MLFLVQWLGEISPNLCWQCLQLYDYFIIFQKYLSCLFILGNFNLCKVLLHAYFVGEISPALTLLSTLKIFIYVNYGVFTGENSPTWAFCIYKFRIISFNSHNIYFSLGDISPELSLVSTIFSSLNFPPPEPIYRRYSYVLFIAISQRGYSPLKLFIFANSQLFLSIFEVFIMCYF